MKKEMFLLSLLMFCPTLRAWADSPGSTGAEFLKVGVGARAMALGGSHAALASDVYSLYWNPAGLARIERAEAAVQVNSYISDIEQHFLAGAYRHKKYGTFGASLNLLGVDGIPRTTVAANGAVTTSGTFGADDLAFTAAFARPITGWLSAGGAAKWIRSTIAHYHANASAADLGLQVKPLSFLSLGLALQNIGTRIKFMSDRDELPMLYRFGAAGEFLDNRALVVTMDLSQARNDVATFGLGVEYTLRRILSLRLGYTTAGAEVDRGLTAGFGVRFRSLNLEYAFIPFGALGDAHRYSLKYAFY
ncbi:MAG: hypothetical protein A3J70_01445 [Elusimicrobia bacterium RIFCSPHIGHO2_02_FULL_61_10]|nr:MAG: hypothetical protein A3G34_11840 [Candidatus Lindowbacteria bacterium RIFCSPLOWO2_12_FULL_62_27]OGS18101.1 MAG: hypothetical protein A3J70_01445 [Elusimicrobia bacterium RIFCSPHIGHO2_02_FULL_61_10]